MFIVFEGIDGAGISTQAELLRRFLTRKGKKVILTKEPTNGVIGGLIRSVLRGELKLDNLSLQLLFAADRGKHLKETILPALRKGYIVISDRYFLSSIAFGGLNVDMDFLKKLNSKFLHPDVTFIIDVSPRVSEKRRKGRIKKEIFESVEKAKRVRENYLKLAKEYERVYVINGERRIGEVAREIRKIINRFL